MCVDYNKKAVYANSTSIIYRFLLQMCAPSQATDNEICVFRAYAAIAALYIGFGRESILEETAGHPLGTGD